VKRVVITTQPSTPNYATPVTPELRELGSSPESAFRVVGRHSSFEQSLKQILARLERMDRWYDACSAGMLEHGHRPPKGKLPKTRSPHSERGIRAKGEPTASQRLVPKALATTRKRRPRLRPDALTLARAVARVVERG
jgi:hypothetical protein